MGEYNIKDFCKGIIKHPLEIIYEKISYLIKEAQSQDLILITADLDFWVNEWLKNSNLNKVKYMFEKPIDFELFKNITINYKSDVNSPLYLVCEEYRLEDIISNLKNRKKL